MIWSQRTALILSAVAVTEGHALTADAAKVAFFESKIRPVLVSKCLECHSADAHSKGKLKASLYLDSRDGVLKGGNTGPAVIEGEPEKSLLIQALNHASKDLAMPPREEKLSAAVIADFTTWVREGAVDPREGTAPVTKKRGMSLADGRKFWSLVPPKLPAVPTVKDAAWALGDVDRFVLQKLEEQRLKPNADADTGTLVRRLYLDLTGLPPAPNESHPSYEKLVDELLESPHFGERWGRHWLDIARYADSNGRDRNIIFQHAWRYRDYVINAVNRDKPFDEFIQEQIAGDLMPSRDQAQRDERLTATAFLALGAKAYEEQKPDIFRMDVIDEQIEVIGRGILGLSVACARCHDHKFDPIPTADYYALAGILRSTQPLYGYGPRGIKATAHHHTEWHALGSDASELAPTALEYFRKLESETLAMHTARSDRYRLQRRLPEAKRKIDAASGSAKTSAEAELQKLETEIADWNKKVAALEKSVADLQDAAPPQPAWTMGARDRERAEDCQIHIRGETTNLGQKVRRGFLQVISLSDIPTPNDAQSGRLELARWLAHRDNPLTARVLVNRVWQKLMGRALVTTLDDFGVNGTQPSHAELLDFLAVRFMEQGWSLKKLVREIVLSRAYRMSSEAEAGKLASDPDNVFLWRMAPRTLEAEVLRDSILALSGQLDPYPPQKQFLERFHPQKDAELSTFKPFLTADGIVDDHRSVYLPVVRGTLPEIFAIFDFAAPERPIAKRDESIVPAQALYLMNSAWVIDQARHTAARLLGDSSLRDDTARVRRLYALAYNRQPESGELKRALEFLQHPTELIPDPKSKTPPSEDAKVEARWASLCQTVIVSAEFRVLR